MLKLETEYLKTLPTIFEEADRQLLLIPKEELTPAKCRNLLNDRLNRSLRKYLKSVLPKICLGRNRRVFSPANIEIKLVYKCKYIGVYSRAKIQVKTPKMYWERRIELFQSGKETTIFNHFLNKTDIMMTLVHELTHLFQDIYGDNFQNTAYFPGGKAFEDVVPPKNVSWYGSNLLHFSRISEVVSYAMEAAFELFLKHKTYEEAVTRLKSGDYTQLTCLRKFNDLGDLLPDDKSLILFERLRKIYFSKIFKNLSELYG